MQQLPRHRPRQLSSRERAPGRPVRHRRRSAPGSRGAPARRLAGDLLVEASDAIGDVAGLEVRGDPCGTGLAEPSVAARIGDHPVERPERAPPRRRARRGLPGHSVDDKLRHAADARRRRREAPQPSPRGWPSAGCRRASEARVTSDVQESVAEIVGTDPWKRTGMSRRRALRFELRCEAGRRRRSRAARVSPSTHMRPAGHRFPSAARESRPRRLGADHGDEAGRSVEL